MAITVAGTPTGKAQSAGSGVTITQAWTPQNLGDLIVVSCAVVGKNLAMSIKDTASHPWMVVGFCDDIINNVTAVTWCCLSAVTTSSTTITLSGNLNNQFMSIMVDGFTGGAFVLDKSTVMVSQNATNPTAGPLAPTYDGSLVFGCAIDTVNSLNTGWTKGGDDLSSDWTVNKILNTGTAGIPVLMDGALGSSPHTCNNIEAIFTVALMSPVQPFPVVPQQRM